MVSMFKKRATCPSSQDLLGYRLSSVSEKKTARIRTHLLSCDFCSAELQLLTRHCADAEDDALVEMPAALRRMAERLLRQSAAALGELSEFVNPRQLSH